MQYISGLTVYFPVFQYSTVHTYTIFKINIGVNMQTVNIIITLQNTSTDNVIPIYVNNAVH